MGLCEFIYNSVKSQILSGSLAPDSKLPSKRSLALNLGVSIITVQNAYAQLISEGFIYSIEKKGFFVTDLSTCEANQFSDSARTLLCESTNVNNFPKTHGAQQRINTGKKDFTDFSGKDERLSVRSAEDFEVDFTSNTTSAEKFPFTLWSHTMRQILSSGDQKLLQSTGVKGAFELRDAISNYLRDFRNLDVNPEQIVIGAGSEYLYGLVVQFLGREKLYAVENPGFKRTKEIFELNGASCVPLEIDEAGMNPGLLRKSNANVAHISPNHHFPTGIVMPVRRRMELLSWCDENKNHFIIEDDYDSEFRFNGKPLPTLQSLAKESKIIYMNTFSKTLSPSFRIGFMVLPPSLLFDFEKKMKSCSCPVSAFEQFTLARFMREGFYEKHINRMRNYYRNLRNSLISEMQKSGLMKFCEIQEEEAGLHFLLKIKNGKSGEKIKKSLAKQGVKIALLSDFFYDEQPAASIRMRTDKKDLKNENFMIKQNAPVFVINYSGLKKENLAKTVEKIKKAIED